MSTLLCTALALLLVTLPAAAVEQFDIEVLERRPQPRDHFVQGLEIVDGKLYVSTGMYGESRLMRYDFASGRRLDTRHLNRTLFAEGVTVLQDTVYQLTWRNRLMLTYERATLEHRGGWPMPGEGWGLTNDGEQLIYSDGSDKLHFISPKDGRRQKSITVRENGAPLRALNELEWIDGSIWANVWGTERIVIIDPASGDVTASVDLEGLLPAAEYRPGTDVLNGIAHDRDGDETWVTGKRWPWLYRIRLVPKIAENVPTPGAKSR